MAVKRIRHGGTTRENADVLKHWDQEAAHCELVEPRHYWSPRTNLPKNADF